MKTYDNRAESDEGHRECGHRIQIVRPRQFHGTISSDNRPSGSTQHVRTAQGYPFGIPLLSAHPLAGVRQPLHRASGIPRKLTRVRPLQGLWRTVECVVFFPPLEAWGRDPPSRFFLQV
jgi:hypothetical protein